MQRLQHVVIQARVIKWYVRDVMVVVRITYRIVYATQIRLELIERRVLIYQIIFANVRSGFIKINCTLQIQ